MPVPLSSYKTPGVYVQEIQKLPPTIAQVATAVPVFIGYTAKAEKDGEVITNVPTRVTSMDQYVRWFGGPLLESLTVDLSLTLDPADDTIIQQTEAMVPLYHEITFRMYYAAQMFFDNGGGVCYVISVGNMLSDAETPVPVSIDYNLLDDAIDLLKKEDEPTLIVFPDAVPPTPPVTTPPTDLDLSYIDTYRAALNFCSDPKINNYFVIMDVGMATLKTDVPLDDAESFRDTISGSIDLFKYGAAYYPFLASSLAPNFDDTTVTLGTVNTESATLKAELEGKTLEEIKDSRNQIYNLVKDSINSQTSLVLPPCGAISGVYAKVDSNPGVFKSPANVSIINIVAPTTKVADVDHDSFNVDTVAGKSINVIRTFRGIGTLVWGARTLAGNDREWRYISVRRFFNMVEESVKRALFRFVFEPNNPNTWISVRASIESFLEGQWRAGALLGNTPNDAYFVRVGVPDTFSTAEMLDGFMVVEIGMAVVRPAEFIVLKFMHKFELGQ